MVYLSVRFAFPISQPRYIRAEQQVEALVKGEGDTEPSGYLERGEPVNRAAEPARGVQLPG
jgi:hypothetical protein